MQYQNNSSNPYNFSPSQAEYLLFGRVIIEQNYNRYARICTLWDLKWESLVGGVHTVQS